MNRTDAIGEARQGKLVYTTIRGHRTRCRLVRDAGGVYDLVHPHPTDDLAGECPACGEEYEAGSTFCPPGIFGWRDLHGLAVEVGQGHGDCAHFSRLFRRGDETHAVIEVFEGGTSITRAWVHAVRADSKDGIEFFVRSPEWTIEGHLPAGELPGFVGGEWTGERWFIGTHDGEPIDYTVGTI